MKTILEQKKAETSISSNHFKRIEGQFERISNNFKTNMENATRDSARLMTDYKKKWIAASRMIPLKSS